MRTIKPFLGIVHLKKGDYAQALHFHKKALAIRLKVMEQQHPEVADIYKNMANVYQAQGEGIIGLTRGFLYAGASNLLVSLWQVSDVTTSGLMVDFYDKMLGAG